MRYDYLVVEDEKLKANFALLESTVNNKNKEIEMLNTTCESLRKEVDQLKQRLQEMSKANDSKIAELKQYQKELEQKISAANEAKDAVEKIVKEKENELTTIQMSTVKDLEAFKSKIVQLENERESRDQDILTFKERVVFFEDLKQKYKVLVTEHNTLKSENEKAFADQRQALQEKLDEVKTLETQYTELHENYSCLEKEKIDLEERRTLDAKSAAKKIEGYEARLASFENTEIEYKKLQTECENLKSEQVSKETLIKKLMEEKNTIEEKYELFQVTQSKTNSETKKLTMLHDNDFEEKLKIQEEAFDMEREKSNEAINDLALQVEKWKELFGKNLAV